MDGNQERSGWVGPAILAGVAGFGVWRSLSPGSRENVWRFLEAMAEEHERKKMAELAQAEQLITPTLEDLVFGSHFLDIPPMEFGSIVEPTSQQRHLQNFATNYEVQDLDDRKSRVPELLDRDRQWLDVVEHPSIVVALGKRGSGKSALGYRLLELNRYRMKPYVVGLPESAVRELPNWLGSVPTLDDLPHDSIALIDEAYLTYHARESMSEKNRSVSQLLNLSRQRNQTLVFITQEARQLDKNITSVADVIVFKKPSALQIESERPELRTIARRANESFAGVTGSARRGATSFRLILNSKAYSKISCRLSGQNS